MGRGGKSKRLTKAPSLVETRQVVASLGCDVFEVGGSIRAELIGKDISDIDVCAIGVSYAELLEKCQAANLLAKPLEVEGDLLGVRVYGPLVPIDGVEIALARKEVSSGPGHHDFSFNTKGVSLEEDLVRRDFTCNALARKIMPDGSLGEIIDPTGGLNDIQNKALRMVSEEMIAEDPLRILRGLVRMSRDGFIPDEKTKEAMISYSDRLRPNRELSAERIYTELNKIMGGERAAQVFRFMAEGDGEIWKNVFPELAPMLGFNQKSKYHSLPVDEHCIRALEVACQMDAPVAVRWAALLHDCGKPESAWLGDDNRLHYYYDPRREGSKDHSEAGSRIAHDLMGRLRFPQKLETEVKHLIELHMFRLPEEGQKSVDFKARKLLRSIGRDNLDNLLLLRRCDWQGKGKNDDDFKRDMAKIEYAEKILRKASLEPIERGDLAIRGSDIVELGASGSQVGEILEELVQRVLADPEKNTRDRLIAWAQKLSH